MIIKFPPAITKDFVLEKVSQEEIFSFYGCPVVPYTFKSPLRVDKNPTCTIRYVNKKLYMRDWSGRFWGDCFDYVQERFGIGFGQCLQKIASDFGLIDSTIVREPKPISEELKEITDYPKLKIKRRSWTPDDRKFWDKYDFHKDTLDFFNVYPIEWLWINDSPSYYYGKNKADIAFAYHFGGYEYKIYFPTREKRRFIHSNPYVLQGYNQLPEKGEVLVITKSLKDVMKLHEFGIPAIAPMAESIWQIYGMEDLRKRFDKIIVFGDNDTAGRRFIINIQQNYNVQHAVLPFGWPKDFTDTYEMYGFEVCQELINNYLNK